MTTQVALRRTTEESVRECLEALGWMAELSPGARGVYHLWATKGRRVWLVHVQPAEAPPDAVMEGPRQRLDLEARQLRATPVVAGMEGGACWLASLRTGRLLEP